MTVAVANSKDEVFHDKEELFVEHLIQFCFSKLSLQRDTPR